MNWKAHWTRCRGKRKVYSKRNPCGNDHIRQSMLLQSKYMTKIHPKAYYGISSRPNEKKKLGIFSLKKQAMQAIQPDSSKRLNFHKQWYNFCKFTSPIYPIDFWNRLWLAYFKHNAVQLWSKTRQASQHTTRLKLKKLKRWGKMLVKSQFSQTVWLGLDLLLLKLFWRNSFFDRGTARFKLASAQVNRSRL